MWEFFQYSLYSLDIYVHSEKLKMKKKFVRIIDGILLAKTKQKIVNCYKYANFLGNYKFRVFEVDEEIRSALMDVNE